MKEVLVNVPVVSYGIQKKKIYLYEELSEEAKEKIRLYERNRLIKDGFAWEKESWESVEKIANLFHCTYEKYSVNGLRYIIYFKYNGDDGELTGNELKAYIDNITKDCSTKNWLDNVLFSFKKYYAYEYGNLYNFLDVLSSLLGDNISENFTYQFSDKGIDKKYTDNEMYFFEDGTIYEEE